MRIVQRKKRGNLAELAKFNKVLTINNHHCRGGSHRFISAVRQMERNPTESAALPRRVRRGVIALRVRQCGVRNIVHFPNDDERRIQL